MVHVIHEVINTPFQVAMDCKHVPDESDHICWNCTIKIIDMAEQLEAERNMYKDGFDALTAANEQIVKERDEALRQYNELKDTHREYLQAFDRLTIINNYRNVEIEKLKRENEAQAKRIKELEDENDELTGFDSSFAAIALKNQNVGIRHTEYEGEYETPLGITLDGQGDEVEP